MATLTLDRRVDVVRDLEARMRSLEHRQRQASVDAAGHAPLPLATGWVEIDRLLARDATGVDGGLMVGAVHEFTCPQTGKGYMFFPIKKL